VLRWCPRPLRFAPGRQRQLEAAAELSADSRQQLSPLHTARAGRGWPDPELRLEHDCRS